MKHANANIGAIGFKAKTGRAIAVVLRGPADSPQFVRRIELLLSDPRVPATCQPYHEVMELPWNQSQIKVKPLVRKIERVAASALRELIGELQSDGVRVIRVGIAGAADRDLSRIGNPHIRAHAAEGVLFRQVLESAAKANGLAKRVFTERGLEAQAASTLQCTIAKLNASLTSLGRSAGPPWRAEQRVAATAAWLALRGSRGD
jgi:hypothetical protein